MHDSSVGVSGSNRHIKRAQNWSLGVKLSAPLQLVFIAEPFEVSHCEKGISGEFWVGIAAYANSFSFFCQGDSQDIV